MKKIKVSAPGKLIISGEHSVVHGHTAIVAAVDRRLAINEGYVVESDIPIGCGMGSSAAYTVALLPLQFVDGQDAESLGLTGRETFDIVGLDGGAARTVKAVARREDGSTFEFTLRARIDTPKELEYYRHGGILQYVLRSLVGESKAA